MKKILLPFTIVVALFSFTSKARAIENAQPHVCLYENTNGTERILITSSGDAYHEAQLLTDIIVTKKGKSKKIDAGYYTNKVYNKLNGFDGFSRQNGCKAFLIYAETSFDDEVYLVDQSNINYKNDKYRTVMTLIDYYEGGTPDNSDLTKMVCNYDRENNIGAPSTFTYIIDYNAKTHLGNMKLYANGYFIKDTDLKADGINVTTTFPWEKFTDTVIDQFDIRKFWNEERQSYSCPPEIRVETKFEKDTKIRTISYGSTGSTDKDDTYYLSPLASYIKYTVMQETEPLQLCVYSYKETQCNKDDATCLTLSAPLTLGKQAGGYRAVLNESLAGASNISNISYNFTGDYDLTSQDKCSKLPKIYTNCVNTEAKFCTISDIYQSGYTELYEDPWANNQDAQDVEIIMGRYESAFPFKTLICDLKNSLNTYADKNLLKQLPKLSVYDAANKLAGTYSITDFPCSESENTLCTTDECKELGDYKINLKALEISKYCSKITAKYATKFNDALYEGKFSECLSYSEFYRSMVNNGIIDNYTDGCGMLSSDLREKLNFVLDILKIAGPLAALGLGTLDFVKAIASGDADKEMKTAWKRFTTRLIAAVLLFIVPIVLAFLMDMFLGNQEGYRTDNPFCGMVDWNTLK